MSEEREILKLAGCLEDVDNDVADLCIKLMMEAEDHKISMADLMAGVQKIKESLIEEQQCEKKG